MSNEPKDKPAEFESASKILLSDGDSAASKYRALTVGETSFVFFLLFELATFFLTSIPGAVGLLLRRKLIGPFFGTCGQGLVIGKHCTIRHPSKIHLGDDVVIDDFCVINARGTHANGLTIGNKTIINRNTQIISKGGDISIGKECAIGSGCTIVSWSGVSIADGVGMASGCVISAGTYGIGQMSLPRNERTAESAGPIKIGSHAWIATRVTILDAVSIGEDSILAACAVVHGDIPPNSVAHGNPADVVFTLRD